MNLISSEGVMTSNKEDGVRLVRPEDIKRLCEIYAYYVEDSEAVVSFEIVAPLNCHGEDLYMDISFIDSPLLQSDPDCINGYLILNPRTVNLVSRALSELYLYK